MKLRNFVLVLIESEKADSVKHFKAENAKAAIGMYTIALSTQKYLIKPLEGETGTLQYMNDMLLDLGYYPLEENSKYYQHYNSSFDNIELVDDGAYVTVAYVK